MSYVNTIKMFVRVYELGSMSAAARDQRTSPAVALVTNHCSSAAPMQARGLRWQQRCRRHLRLPNQ